MWDTRASRKTLGPGLDIRSKVTLAVLQKFLYFTTAIVCTIGFQLEADVLQPGQVDKV